MSFGYSKIQTLDIHQKADGFSSPFSLSPLCSVNMPYLQCMTVSLLLVLHWRKKGKCRLYQLG